MSGEIFNFSGGCIIGRTFLSISSAEITSAEITAAETHFQMILHRIVLQTLNSQKSAFFSFLSFSQFQNSTQLLPKKFFSSLL